MGAGDGLIHAQAAPLGEAEREIELGQLLPGLLVDAQVASQEMRGDQQAAGLGLLAHSYEHGLIGAAELGDKGLTVIAADRAVQEPVAPSTGAEVWWLCWGRPEG